MVEEIRIVRLLTAFTMGCFAFSLSGCEAERSDSFTLYRNSALDHSLRVHWASFNANDKDNYNMNNCLMAARLLNANVSASAKADGK